MAPAAVGLDTGGRGHHSLLNWLCYIASHATDHAAGLDRQTMQRVLALPGDSWLGVCGDHLDD